MRLQRNRGDVTLNSSSRRKAVAMKLRPLLILLIVIPLITFMMYPMVNMEPRDIHVGVVNLDMGAEFENGKVNLGEKMMDNILNPEEDQEGADSPVVWEVYDSEEEAENAISSKQIYGYLVIPKKFSESQTEQLEAFEKMADALGAMSDGTGKIGTAIDAMGSNINKLPVMFGKLSEATSGLETAADNLGKVSGTINTEADAISKAMGDLQNSNKQRTENIADASDVIDELRKADKEELTEEKLNEYLDRIQGHIDAVGAGNEAVALKTVGQNAAMIAAQSKASGEGLANVKKAEGAMSENFNTMAKNMSKAGKGAAKLSGAAGALSGGLGEISGKLDNQVGEAIDTINGESEEDEEDSDNNDASLLFTLDQSRNVMISTTLVSAINGMSANAGIHIDIDYLNEISEDTNNMYFVMVFMMMTMFASMIPGILTGLLIRGVKTRKERLKTIAAQLVLAILIAPCVGFALPRVVIWMTGTELPVDDLTKFVCIASFSLLILIIGSIDILGLPGVAVPALIMLCGTAVANLPYEFLPEFWQQHVHPWEPLRFIADGIRTILYWGGNYWNDYSQDLLYLVPIGCILMALAIAKPAIKEKTEGNDALSE